MAPPTLFFFALLLPVLLVFKLVAAQYAIEFYAFSKAAVGAAILGKVVLVMERAEGKRARWRLPLALVVAIRTAIYALAVIAFGIGERVFHAVRETHSLQGGFELVLANARVDRFLSLVILASLMIGAYLAFEQINHAMGPGALRQLFLSRPPAAEPNQELANAG